MGHIQVVRYEEFGTVSTTTTSRKRPPKEPISRSVREFYRGLNDLLKYELKLTTQYANVDMTRLSGRPVSGGLPSLGRR